MNVFLVATTVSDQFLAIQYRIKIKIGIKNIFIIFMLHLSKEFKTKKFFKIAQIKESIAKFITTVTPNKNQSLSYINHKKKKCILFPTLLKTNLFVCKYTELIEFK